MYNHALSCAVVCAKRLGDLGNQPMVLKCGYIQKKGDGGKSWREEGEKIPQQPSGGWSQTKAEPFSAVALISSRYACQYVLGYTLPPNRYLTLIFYLAIF